VLSDLASLIASYAQESVPELLHRHFKNARDDFLSITECLSALILINEAKLHTDRAITECLSELTLINEAKLPPDLEMTVGMNTLDFSVLHKHVAVRDGGLNSAEGSKMLNPVNEARLLGVFLPYIKRLLDGLPLINEWPVPMRNDDRCTSEYCCYSLRTCIPSFGNVLDMLNVALLLEKFLDDMVDHRMCKGWMHTKCEYRGLSTGIIQNPIGRYVELLTRVLSARLNSAKQNARLQEYWQPFLPLRRKFELAWDISVYNESKECMIAAVVGLAIGVALGKVGSWIQ
jgi:hypothetical protein